MDGYHEGRFVVATKCEFPYQYMDPLMGLPKWSDVHTGIVVIVR